jgi:hypothetical protein
MTNYRPDTTKNNPDKRKPTVRIVGVKHFALFDVNITILYIRQTIDENANQQEVNSRFSSLDARLAIIIVNAPGPAMIGITKGAMALC